MSFWVKKCCAIVKNDNGWALGGGYRWTEEVTLTQIPEEVVGWTDGEILRWCARKGVLQREGAVKRGETYIRVDSRKGKPLLVIWLNPVEGW